MSKIIISPSILSADFANLERDIRAVQEAGADWIHVDVMDGHFVPNLTIGAPVVESVRRITRMPLDVHLMIENPGRYIDAFAEAGADILTFHFEAAEESALEIIKAIKRRGMKAGISIKPKTSADEIMHLLKYVNLVLVMTVEPGFGGQKFMRECADKIPLIKFNAPEGLIIQVDGGINAETAKICTSLGANSLVAGNYIYKSRSIKEAVESLR